VFLAAAIFFSLHAVYTARVGAREQQITATVYAPGQWNHGPVYKYRFVLLDEMDFNGESGTPGDARLAIGQPVTVYYDPSRPRTNSLTSFAQARPSYVMILLYVCGAIAFAIFGAIQWRRTPEGLND
jgi:hypothetical protein